MYTAPATVADPVGPRPFLCHECRRGVDEIECACGWDACDCMGCRQNLRLERYAPEKFIHEVRRGLIAIGCSGNPRPRETEPEPVANAPTDKPAPPPEPPVPPAPEKVQVPFRALLRMCGLSHAEAAIVLGQSESSVKKKSSGALAMTSADRIALRTVWNRVCNGDLDGLQPGSVEASAALRALQA